MAHAGGRPNIYDPVEIADRLQNYADSVDNPILAGFCMVKGNPCKDTLYELAKDCTELSDCIKRLVYKQEVYCQQNHRGNMDIFVLKQKYHGYTDKSETKLTGKDGDPLQIIVKVTDGES